MDAKINSYLKLEKLFAKNGFSLYLVGGTVRDYLLNLSLTDMDAATDAKPQDIEKFLPNANFTFAKYGSISYKDEDDVKFDITTLREEKKYLDSRHPDEIKFVKNLSIDVQRRDFTINALYLNKDLEVIDYVNGQQDLNDHVLRMIGNPKNRLKEDPLRIIRALRFAIDYNLTIDKQLDKAMKESIPLLENINIDKIKQDINKMKSSNQDYIAAQFAKYNIKHLVDVVE